MKAERPNILFCIADDWGHPHAGAYGCSWVNTPHFNRVAKEGVLFANCFTPNAKCAPSRAAVLTGRYSWQLEEACGHWNYFPEKFAVYPEILSESGYRIGYTGKGWAPGNPGYRPDGSVRELTGPAFHLHELDPPESGMSKKDYAANFEAFLGDRDGRPFCFWYGGHEPHRAYEYRAGIEKAGKKITDIPAEDIPPYWPDREDVRTDMLDYAFEVEWFDRHLGRMLDLLEKHELLDDTLVVVTSDNGPPFPRMKGQQYEQSFHMPMAAMWRGRITPGRTVDDLINFVDLAPTFLEIAGREPHPQMTGTSFLPQLRSSRSGQIDPSRCLTYSCREGHDLGRRNNVGYPIRGLRTSRFLFLRNYEPDRWPGGDPELYYRELDDGPTKSAVVEEMEKGNDIFWQYCLAKRPENELFDISKDPQCVRNLSQDVEFMHIRNELLNDLELFCRKTGDPRMLGRRDYFDTFDYIGMGEVATVYKMWQKVKQSGGKYWFKERWPRDL